MGRTACTEPQCLYKGALYLLNYSLPYWQEDVLRIQQHSRYTSKLWV